MIVVLKGGSSDEQVAEVMRALEALGMTARILGQDGKPLIHVISGPTRRARRLLTMDRVQALVPTSGPRIREHGRRFYPYHFVGWCAGFLLLIGALVFLAGQLPPGLGEVVNVNAPPDHLVPPWYLRLPAGFLKGFPARYSAFAWPTLLGVGLLFFLLPLLDRTRGRGLKARVALVLPGLLVILALVLFSLRGVAS